MSGRLTTGIGLIFLLGSSAVAVAQSAQSYQSDLPRSLSEEISAQAKKREALYERYRRDGDARYAADQVRDKRLRRLSATICDGCTSGKAPSKSAALHVDSTLDTLPSDPAVAGGAE